MADSAPGTSVGVWNALLKELGSDYQASVILFHPAYSLLGDAIRSYDASAVPAACAMCRAATEAACYIFLTRRKTPLRAAPHTAVWTIEYPIALTGEPREVSFGELAAAVRKRNVLARVELRALERIQHDGNFSVHAAAGQDRVLHRLTRAAKKPQNLRVRTQVQIEPVRNWASKAEAYRNIADTARILARLVKAAGHWTESRTERAEK